MAATNRLFQDFIEFATDADPGSTGTTLSAPGLADLIAVADPDFIPLTLDPDAENGDPEIVWVTAHTASATTATISRGEEGTAARAHPVGTKAVAALTADALPEIVGSYEVDNSAFSDNPALTSTLADVETVTLSIPLGWNSWKCQAWATYAATGSGGDGVYDVVLQIDGTDIQLKDGVHAELNEIREGALVADRTGMTTTGNRTVALRGRETSGQVILRDVYLYARAVRTS